ncbi:MAG: hypothetical protein PHH37_12665 [Paludibacter sp.]|nr:hypothetical protein [Paludibacter sp.]
MTKIYWKLFIIIVIVGLFSSCSKCDDRTRIGFNGKVKVCLIRGYEPIKQFDEWDAGTIKSSGHIRMFFDEAGNEYKEELVDGNNQLHYKILSQHDEKNIRHDVGYDEKDSIIFKRTLSFSKNKLVFSIFDNDGQKKFVDTVFYKKNKLKKEISIALKNNSIIDAKITMYEYDKNNNIISEKQIKPSGEISFYTKYKYIEFDEKNNWTKRLDFDGKNPEKPELVETRVFKYY